MLKSKRTLATVIVLLAGVAHAADPKPEVQIRATSPDQKTTLVAEKDKIQLIDAATQKAIREVKTTKDVTALAFAPDGKTFTAATKDKSISLWDVTTGKEIRRITCNIEVIDLSYSNDGKILTAKSADKSLEFEVATGKLITQDR